MTTEFYSTRRNPSGLYWKAYRWAWSNLRNPTFSASDVKAFNLPITWAWFSVFFGFFSSVTACLVVFSFLTLHRSFAGLILNAFICLLVWPATQATVIWTACMVRSIKKHSRQRPNP